MYAYMHKWGHLQASQTFLNFVMATIKSGSTLSMDPSASSFRTSVAQEASQVSLQRNSFGSACVEIHHHMHVFIHAHLTSTFGYQFVACTYNYKCTKIWRRGCDIHKSQQHEWMYLSSTQDGHFDINICQVSPARAMMIALVVLDNRYIIIDMIWRTFSVLLVEDPGENSSKEP